MCFQRIWEWLKKIFSASGNGNGGIKPTPALANTFLFVEPQQHYLEYSSKVLYDLIAKNKSAGQNITELIGNDANAANVKAALASMNPIVFAMCGHGNYTTTTVECTELLMQVGDNVVPTMNGRIVHLNSCQTAATLGPAIVSAGAIAFVGSNESFWFYTGDAANSTRAVQSPFLAEWQFVVSLLQGKSVGDARAEQLKKYEEELSYWVEGDGKNHPDAGEIARIININKAISTFIGDTGQTPSPAGSAPSAALPPSVVIPIAVAASAIVIWYVFLR